MDPAEATTGSAADARWPYRLAFIEFDDRGEIFDRRQLEHAMGAVASAKQDAQALGRKPIVAVFVHGWKNNADDSSGNVWGFRQTLAGLAKQFGPPRAGGPARAPVVGVYIGWRGAVTNVPVLEELTFWDRHAKSENLPNAHMLEVLLKILQQAKGPLYEDSGAIAVLVGHSFGGAVLESALTQTIEQMVLSQPIHSPADLTILLNEAQEATRSYQLIDSMKANGARQDHCHAKLIDGRTRRFENPIIVSVSSTADYATRAFFPFGQAFLRPFNSLRHYPAPNSLGIESQRPMFFNTTAHMSEFQSHLVEMYSVGAPVQSRDPEVQQAEASGCVPYLDYPDPNVPDIHYRIIAKLGSRNDTPYWVMQIPAAIVPDHSTIFTRSFRAFLVGLICAHTGACQPPIA
jgi:pimeloyl-ACP methyl ester carboxylesterase